jgi:hypothetical protein
MNANRDGHHSTDEDEMGRDPIKNPTGSDEIAGEDTATDEPDVVFRVSLPEADEPVESLEDHYRDTLKDLLQVVRFSFRGEPVLVDAFTFLNRPEREIRILREDDLGTT